jgi:hypothetical protein
LNKETHHDKSVLPKIIHHNQNAYVKGRTVFDAIRTIDDIIDFTKRTNIPGLLVAIDFEKAFDSLNWDFLIKTLENFNFGLSFITWIKTFYNNITSSVLNNGHSTNYFRINKGVRQGDPLSAYLFIIALEILAINIRENQQIKGLKIGEHEIKLNIFADDLTAFLKNKSSYMTLLECADEFSICSGLKINKEKTEAMWLGSAYGNRNEMLDIKNIDKPIKILGIYFTYNEKKRNELNFDATLKSIKKNPQQMEMEESNFIRENSNH